MSYGFRIRNANGNVLVSDETYNPVYVGRATKVSHTDASTRGGTITADNWRGVFEVRYTITLPNGGTPLPFIVDDGVNMPASVVGIKSDGGNNWSIYVFAYKLQPQIIVFAQGVPEFEATGHGLRVLKDDSTVAFDSNQKHLVLASVIQAAAPICSGSVPGLETCNYKNTTITPIPNCPATPAFSYVANSQKKKYSGSSSFGSSWFYAPVADIQNNNLVASFGFFYYLVGSGGNSQWSQADTPQLVLVIDASKYP